MFDEMKMMEDEKGKAMVAAQERKVPVEQKGLEFGTKSLTLETDEKNTELEEQKLALVVEEQKRKRVVKDRAIMFMDPNNMVERARQYWQFSCRYVLAKMCGGDNDEGGGNGSVDGDGSNA